MLTAPLVHSGWPLFLWLDLWVSLYQGLCFPVHGIPRVHRAAYLVFDRSELPYLNLIGRLNCFYCSYANGVVAYAREVGARTEQYWCPIKHARRLLGMHERYPTFFEFGDSRAYREGLARLRRQYPRARVAPPGESPSPRSGAEGQ